MVSVEKLTRKVQYLPKIPVASQLAYVDAESRLVQRVNDEIRHHPRISEFLGSNTLQLLENNHRHHASLMVEVMNQGDYQLLVESLPWVYRAYHNQGVAFDYFAAENTAWMAALAAELEQGLAVPILAVYQWMQDSHKSLIEVSMQEPVALPQKLGGSFDGLAAQFVAALQDSNHRLCLETCREAKQLGMDLPTLFENIIYPAMLEVGLGWEHGSISIAGEHEATAVVNMVLSTLYFDAQMPAQTRGVALVTASPGEHHEIGGWMIATCLELDGWDVVYLGADLPTADIVNSAAQHKVKLVAMSIAMPFNLGPARQVIESLRANTATADAKILIGGGVFLRYPFVAANLGADACLHSCQDAVTWAREFDQ
jgi:methanogenic corrinoid protein MtbC1